MKGNCVVTSNDSGPASHTDDNCLVGGDHSVIKAYDLIAFYVEGICPLCLHDMWFEDACIECLHAYTLGENGLEVQGLNVIGRENADMLRGLGGSSSSSSRGEGEGEV